MLRSRKNAASGYAKAVFEYSMAWLLPIAGLSFVIAWLKFRKLSKLPDISKGMALLISGLRFIVIFTLGDFYKLNP